MFSTLNTRLLVIDDEEVIRDSFREILKPRKTGRSEMAAAGDALFGDLAPSLPRSSSLLEFTLDEARNGREGLELVQKAISEGRPYAVLFVDMRMPGWDGLETVRRIREVDRQAEVIFVTAYSDHSIEEVVRQVGANVGYHCKPFSPEEIRQLATKACLDWSKLRTLEHLLELASNLKLEAPKLETLLRNILHQVTHWIGTDSAMLVSLKDGRPDTPVLVTGVFEEPATARDCLQTFEAYDPPPEGELLAGSYHFFRLGRYAVLANPGSLERHQTEKVYLFRLFLEHAAAAIENARLHEELLQKQKLSAIGEALGYVVHDLRSPVGAIKGAAEVLPTMKNPASQAKLCQLMSAAADEALRTVEDILDFTREAGPRKAETSLQALFERLQERLTERASKAGVEMVFELQHDVRFHSDEHKVARAIINLVGNAIDAVARRPDASVTVRGGRVNGSVYLSVEDNGPGLPEAIRGELFKPFRTHGKAGGTGLGLAIVKQVVDSHGGQIGVDSTGQGTTFRIALPLQ